LKQATKQIPQLPALEQRSDYEAVQCSLRGLHAWPINPPSGQ
jgi:hypothetical protein